MADYDPQLVRMITEAVVRALAEQGDRADIKPPIGVCTGDYSKFAERPDLVELHETTAQEEYEHTTTSPAAPPPPAVMSPAPTATPALTGIITAQQLQEAIAHAPDGVAALAADARLTPLAHDYARENPGKIRRSEANPGHHASSSLAAPWLWWAEGHCPAVVTATNQLGGKVAASAAARSDSGLVQVIRDIAAGVRGGSLTGGLLFVRSAAKAAVLVNRCPHLRAVVGTCPEAVEQGVQQIGANVLIVEYPYTSAERLAAMATRITQGKPSVSAYVERVLADLHRNG